MNFYSGPCRAALSEQSMPSRATAGAPSVTEALARRARCRSWARPGFELTRNMAKQFTGITSNSTQDSGAATSE